MKKIVEYKIAMGMTPKDLTDEVNSMIQEGWVPQGGIYVMQGPPRQAGDYAVVGTFNLQAMVKTED